MKAETYNAIAFPTVVVAAENDPVTLPSASQFLTNSIPEAYGVTLPMAKHQGQMEMHEPFLGALKAFIQKSLTGSTAVPNHSGRATLVGPKSVSATQTLSSAGQRAVVK